MRKVIQQVALAVALALVVSTSALTVVSNPAAAVPQSGGDEVPTWLTGWSWSYNRTFNITGDGMTVNMNQTGTYTVLGTETQFGQEVYRLGLAGAITSGNGSVVVEGTGTANLHSFSGTVTGTQFVRVSDLAMVQNQETHNLAAKATLSIVTVDITAVVNITQTPTPAQRGTIFRLHDGDSWSYDYDQAVIGTFDYDAGSLGGTGHEDLDLSARFQGEADVTSPTISVPIGSTPVKYVKATPASGPTLDDQWYAPSHHNLARQRTVVQSEDGATTLTMERLLAAKNTPGVASLPISATVSPDTACGGQQVTVSGTVTGASAGQAVSVRLDKSPVTPGDGTNANTATTAGGAYTTTLTAPSLADGADKDDARGSYGIVVRSGTGHRVATLVVGPQDCTSLTYNGATAGEIGAPATVSATLLNLATGSPVAGATVDFTVAGVPGTFSGTTNGAGLASATVPLNPPVRNATVTATAPATATRTSATATGTIAVSKILTTTNVSSSNPEPEIGQPVTFTAQVAEASSFLLPPTGTVTFFVDGAQLGLPVPIDGSGSATSSSISSLSIGTHGVVGVYSGDANYAGSTSPELEQLVLKLRVPTTTALTSSVTTTRFGQATTLTATVNEPDPGTPGGDVTFKAGSTVLDAVALSGGSASLVVDDLPVGTHSLTAVYTGDPDFAPSTSPSVTQSVLKSDTSVAVVATPAAPVAGEPINVGITISPVAPGAAGIDGPTGSVQVAVDGTNVGSPVSVVGGQATVSVPALDAGTRTITATYSGDATFNGSIGTLGLPVAKAATSAVLTSVPNPSEETQAATFTATIVPATSGTPTGTVTFYEGGAVLGAASLVGGSAAIQLANLPIGDHTVHAVYGGDGNHDGSTSDPIVHTVIEQLPIVATETTVAANADPTVFGQPLQFTATVTAEDGSVPPGTVQFSLDGTDLGGPQPLDGDGRATSPTIPSPAAGGHTVIATYSGDFGLGASGVVATHTVAQASVAATITSSADPAAYGQPVTYTATLTPVAPGAGTPGGAVQFRLNGAPLGTPVTLVSGVATSVAVSGLEPGTHTVSILSTGDANFTSATAGFAQDVDRIPTTTTLAATPNPVLHGQLLTLTATVSASGPGVPTGTVTFREGTTVLGTSPVSTTGSVTTATLAFTAPAAGPHTYTATYDGDTKFGTSLASAPVTVNVTKASTSLAATPAVLKLQLTLGITVGVTLLDPLRAFLTSGGVPVAGQLVTFKAGAVTLCTSVTDANGMATCNQQALLPLLQLVLSLGYTVTYAGDANFLPVSGSAGLITLN